MTNRLQEAKHYAHLMIKRGLVDEDLIETLSDEALIEWAEEQMDRGDSYVNQNE